MNATATQQTIRNPSLKAASATRGADGDAQNLPQEGALESATRPAPPQPPGRPPTVLLLDDDSEVLASLRALLERFKAHVTLRTVHNPSDGLDVVDHEHVDLIVTDYRMPGMSGLEFWEHVTEVAPQTQAIMITAFPEAALAQKARALGVARFLVKPFDPDELLRAIDRALAEAT